MAVTDDQTDVAKRKAVFTELQKKLSEIRLGHPHALAVCGEILGKFGQYQAASEKFEQALRITPDDIDVLNNYGLVLVEAGQYEAAVEKFEQALVIDPGRPNTLFLYAVALAKQSKYKDAISRLEKISSDRLSQDNANLVYVTLAQLHSLNRSKIKGNEYFELAIQSSAEKDAKKIAEAQRIFAKDPYSEEGIAILKEIRETSPRYAQAFKLLSLNLSPKAYYQMFSIQAEDTTLHDTEMLNRAMYHKIANEVNILKSIAYRISYNGSDKNGVLSEIIEAIENIPDQIKKRREASQTRVKAIPKGDYESVMETIAETVYDISDLVNNELAVIESKVRRMLQLLSPSDPTYPQDERLLAQLEFTQTALNDLKAINEGITIRYHRFYVKELFEKWVEAPTLGNATITLDIQNGQSEFNGDAEKIKSALNELVENSLKHNPDQTDLVIQCLLTNRVLFLFDRDVRDGDLSNKGQDFENLYIRRVDDYSRDKKGIESLLSETLLEEGVAKGFVTKTIVQTITATGSESRYKYEVTNKTSFCNWVCDERENSPTDFAGFQKITNIIKGLSVS